MLARKPPVFLIIPALLGLLVVVSVLGYGLTHIWEKSLMGSGSYNVQAPDAPVYGKPISHVGGQPMKLMGGS